MQQPPHPPFYGWLLPIVSVSLLLSFVILVLHFLARRQTDVTPYMLLTFLWHWKQMWVQKLPQNNALVSPVKHVTHQKSSHTDSNEGVHTAFCWIIKEVLTHNCVKHGEIWHTARSKMMATCYTDNNGTHSSCFTHLTVIKPYLSCPNRCHTSIPIPYAPSLSDTNFWLRNAQIHEIIWYNVLFKCI